MAFSTILSPLLLNASTTNSNPSPSSRRPSHLPTYFILLQHSLHLPLRVTAATPPTSSSSSSSSSQQQSAVTALYEAAGVMEPRDACRRDLCGGLVLREIIAKLCEENDKIVLVATTTTRTTVPWSVREGQRADVVDLASDPLGWETDDDDEGPVSRIDDLQSILRDIESRAKDATAPPCPLVFDSLDTILLTHGANRTLALLERVRRNPSFSLVVASMRRDVSPLRRHRVVEDVADALVMLEGGRMEVLRRSVRGSGKVVREEEGFGVIWEEDERGGGGVCRRRMDFGRGGEKKEGTTAKGVSRVASSDVKSGGGVGVEGSFKLGQKVSTTVTTTTAAAVTGRPRVTLRHEEGTRLNPAVENKGPRIFLQDDDPEFDDLDEEDPDDDLDL